MKMELKISKFPDEYLIKIEGRTQAYLKHAYYHRVIAAKIFAAMIKRTILGIACSLREIVT